MQIDSLTDPQKQIIRLLHAGQPVPKRLTASAQALAVRGYLDTQGALTNAGQALIDESLLRGQTPADFQKGEAVEYSSWSCSGSGVWTHQWRAATVERRGKIALKLRMQSGLPEWRRATKVRKVSPHGR